MATEFDNLLPFQWRDVQVPLLGIRFSFAHDLIEHKYWGVDGGRVEDTGLAPFRISARIPIGNRIVPGTTERWQAGKLFPGALRTFVISFARREVGMLQHPEFGRLKCRAERLEFELTAERRDGTVIEASWVETSDDDVSADAVARPVNALQTDAASLDASKADLKKLVPKMPEYEETFEDFARGIQGIGDQITLLSNRTAGKIDAIAYRVDQVQASIDRAKNALTWPATQNIERIKAATHNLRQTLLAAGKDLQIYTVLSDTTLAGVQAVLPDSTSLPELIKLNPVLVSSPVVAAGTRVRHYVARIAA